MTELMFITEMKRGSGTHYPYVSDGKGKGMLEDTSTYELIEIIKEIDETGSIPRVFDYISERERDWDYRDFDLKYCNIFFKDNVLKIQYAYENVE